MPKLVVAAGHKRCGGCRDVKPLDEFHRSKTGGRGRAYRCRPCASAHNKSYVPADPIDVSEKACRDCGAVKPVSDFHRDRASRDGFRVVCKACQHLRYQEHRSQQDIEAYRESQLRKKYLRRFGLTLEEVDARRASVAYSCEACGVHMDATHNKALVLDHDHSCCPGENTCGQCIRGVLCTKCNVALGVLGDDPLRVIALMEYITDRTGVVVSCQG